MIRKIIFRGKSIQNGRWIEGDLLQTEDRTFIADDWMIEGEEDDYTSFDCGQLHEIDPRTVGQFTGMHEFVVTDPSVCAPLFEGDIVEFWVIRHMPGEGCKSQYDGDCKIRATIVFKHGAFKLDLNNPYTENVFAAKGSEKYDRDFCAIMSFTNFSAQFNNNLDVYRARNKNYKWGDIVRIGNIYDNPKLLKE